MVSEGLNRWQFAGCFRNRKCVSIVPVSTAGSRSASGCGTANYSPLTRPVWWVTLTFPTGVGARI
jgi:hypothetical protein